MPYRNQLHSLLLLLNLAFGRLRNTQSAHARHKMKTKFVHDPRFTSTVGADFTQIKFGAICVAPLELLSTSHIIVGWRDGMMLQ